MKPRKHIFAVLLIALVGLLVWRDAERSPTDADNESDRPATPPADESNPAPYFQSRSETVAATNPPSRATNGTGVRLNPGPVVAPNTPPNPAPTTNATGQNVVTISPGAFIPPPTPPVPPPTEAGRADAPVVPPGRDRSYSGP